MEWQMKLKGLEFANKDLTLFKLENEKQIKSLSDLLLK